MIDGDTIKVEIDDTVYTVRYIGIDCPEMDQQFGGEAAEANRTLVEGQNVTLERDVSDVDRFDRLLRYVYLPTGALVNAELVRKGYAIAKQYPPDTRRHREFEQIQTEAEKAHRGIWSLTPVQDATPTTTPSPTEADVRIVAVDKKDEYVDIRNSGGQDQDLSGWVLLSEKGDQACSLSGILMGGQTLRIWAMAEDAGEGGYNCGFGSNIWNNSESDPAVLFDAAGHQVSRW